MFVVEDKPIMELDHYIFPSVLQSKHIEKQNIQLKDKQRQTSFDH